MSEQTKDLATRRPQPLSVDSGRVGVSNLDQIWTLASRYAACNMLPKGFDRVEPFYIALVAGYEAGMSLTLAARSVMVVNNRPTIWGDGAVGLVRASGLCEWITEKIEGEGDNRVAVARTLRRGEPEAIERRFSVADAKKASLWAKGGPWSNYPERMLAARARAFLLRDVYADVLGGLHVREEVEDIGTGSNHARPASNAADTADALTVEGDVVGPTHVGKSPALPAPDDAADVLEATPGENNRPDLSSRDMTLAAVSMIMFDRFGGDDGAEVMRSVKLAHALKTQAERDALYAAAFYDRIEPSGKIRAGE